MTGLRSASRSRESQGTRAVLATTNRLTGFNAERSEILAEVHARVVNAYLKNASRGGDNSLEYILNEVAFSEIRRLESSPNSSPQRQIHRWRDLSNRLLRMSESEKRAELESLTWYYCRDIVGNFNPRVFRFASGVVPPVLSFLLSPVSSWREGMAALTEVGEKVQIQGPVDAVRAACRRGTLVVTPTHSSNLDSIVLALGLLMCGLPPVTYGAGKNLFTNPFISYFMRNLGAYRVDRRLRFQLYKDILKEYSTVLLERGYHSLFFPGGTRSRSNRIEERLKLGLLGTAVAAYRNNLMAGKQEGRIYLVPVTINYRLVLEAETLIEDYLAETGKSRYIIDDDEFTRLGRMIEFGRKILAHKGAVIVRFGQPIDPFGNRVDGDGESRDRRGRLVDPVSYLTDGSGEIGIDTQREAEYTRVLSRSLMESYRRDTVFLPTQVVARVLMDEIARRAGTRDIYRLLRLTGEAVRVPMSRLCDAVERLRKRISTSPPIGVLDGSLNAKPTPVVVGEALMSFGRYHTRAVVVPRDREVWVESMKLLYYYNNRLSHVAEEGVS
ncbi:MAG: 1-acyl-sn-glycerol-3-phosphate acyltransferase [Proteobacteria bacterium]|nr:1-acyl-sn-glycerol-3-phosphate acyltransferase [Pseudomonadota bacterium]